MGIVTMMTPLDRRQLKEALDRLPEWSLADDRLVRTYSFSSFREAISFLVRVAFEAEEMDHHPEIRNVYSRVDISLTTHDAGDKVTEKDVEFARRIEHFAWV
jgi:4a-hydroxytetrahydrobiopterin dehydratase